MSTDEIVRALRESLPPKIDYAELVGAEGFAHGACYVWDDPLPYLMSNAADALESQQAQLDASQRREQAAKADLKEAASELTGIGTCVVCRWGPEEPFDGPHCGKCTQGNCQFEWRGPQGAEEDEAK